MNFYTLISDFKNIFNVFCNFILFPWLITKLNEDVEFFWKQLYNEGFYDILR